MSHTKGRLRLGGISQNDGSISIGHAVHPVVIAYVTNAASFGDIIAAKIKGKSGAEPDDDWAQMHNARRIVALWNAAEELGLTTEDIEAGAIQAVFREPLVILQDGPTRAAAIRSLTKDTQS